ncbi:MAG: TonB-dependent receptor [Sphingomonas sp.]|uniref:TonB-dependent receptor domain-containing protein n=1 Tax=Sphingomonas sp. TaxID=28214 RepID=UPI001213A2F4|nr:TonB-dependent receptor [Sphingomonas sp.]THD34814.1 MAG: TonB-dependent receptor [Sphingomonas sp.]
MNISRLLSATALVSCGLLAPQFAYGADKPAGPAAAAPAPQTTPNCDPAQDPNCQATDDKSDAEIVITGSRIRRPNLESTVPITSVQGESFFQNGQTSIGDALNELPQLRSTFAQTNPGLGIGIAGLNLLDLRGLGTQRTLVLVNGRRHVPADILNNAVSVDTNSISADLIERVDIVTGGNSAVYGSDAIAGVVNFVLRRDFNGLQVRGQAGVTGQGYGGNQFVSAMYGKNFADGRGNITLQGEYTRSERVFASDVDAFRVNRNFATVDADGGSGIVNGGDGYTDNALFNDLRSTTIYYGGLVPINQRNVPNAGACGNATTAANGPPNTAGTAFNCTYLFADNGRLIAQTGTRFGTGLNSGINGGNGQTGREAETVSVLPQNQRYGFNLLGHYEFDKALEFFVEAKWNRVKTVGNNAGPSFNQGTGGTTDFRERPRLDNPFLNPADRTTLANLILASGCRTDLQVICPAAGNLTATDIANINNGSFRFVDARNLLDVGLRDEHFQRDTYRVVAGFRGTFNDDWSYELSANYGQFRESTTTSGYIDRQRFALAMDAGRNPVTGQIQCRSQFDPASAVQLSGFSPSPDPASAATAAYNAANAARLAADIAACVPYNPFGTPDNTASINYFSRTFTVRAGLSQFVGSGFVSGDLSQLFELPGGPVSFAIGGEYRRETAFYKQDPFVVGGFTNGVSIPPFVPKPFEVKEAYGELRIPVLKDMPFFDELTISGAGRVSGYQGKAGTVWTYNAGVDYAPIKDIRFRANYSRAVRAPNVSETGFPLVPNFSNGFVDPCNPAQIGSGIRKTNCQTDLGPLLANLTDITQSLPIVSGSNPNLNVEKSDSYTYGVVVQPRFIRGMSLSVDYYNIKVNGVIATIAPQTIVNQCYDSATLNNIYCALFTRYRGTGPGPLGEVPGRILGNSLTNVPLNFAKRVRRGIDVNFDYRHDFGGVALDTSLVYVHSLTNSNYQDPTNPAFETRILDQLGDPQDEFRWDVAIGVKPFTFGYRMHYIGPQWRAAYATTHTINGLPPSNIDAFPTLKYPGVFYNDIRLDIDVGKGRTGGKLKFYMGIDNVLNQGVPDGATTATGTGSAIFEYRGRSFYAGFKANF